MTSATWRLFERWRTARGYASQMAACEELGVERQAATYWKSGRNAEAQTIERMARDLGENPTPWVLAAASEKTRTADERRTLMRLARELGYAAAVLLAVYTSIPPTKAKALELNISATEYALRIVRRCVARMLLRSLAWLNGDQRHGKAAVCTAT